MSSTNEWPLVKLGKLVEKTSETKGSSDIPVYSITKHAGFVSDYFKKNVHSKDQSKYKVVNEGEFAYATIHLDEGSIGIAPEKAAVSPMYTTFRIVSADIDPQFLLRFLKSDAALVQYTILGTGSIERRKNINFEAFSRLSIPLPPLAEQQRIAEIFDTISSNLALRKTQLEQLSTLQKSIFERFHLAYLDQATKYHFKDVVPRIDSGKSPVCESHPAADNEWGVLKLSAVTTGEFLQDENKAYLEDTESLSHLEIQPGDLLMTRKNTPELVGAVSLVRETRPNLLLPDLIFRLNLNKDLVKPEYLAALLMSPPVRFSIRSLAGGSAKSMSNISKQRLNKLLIDLPPLNAQREFVTKSQEIQAIKRKVNSAYKLDQELLASLQARAFAGHL